MGWKTKRKMLFKLDREPRKVEKAPKEPVLSMKLKSFKSGAKGPWCTQFFRKETEEAIVRRRFAKQCLWDPHLCSSEGVANGQRDGLLN